MVWLPTASVDTASFADPALTAAEPRLAARGAAGLRRRVRVPAGLVQTDVRKRPHPALHPGDQVHWLRDPGLIAVARIVEAPG